MAEETERPGGSLGNGVKTLPDGTKVQDMHFVLKEHEKRDEPYAPVDGYIGPGTLVGTELPREFSAADDPPDLFPEERSYRAGNPEKEGLQDKIEIEVDWERFPKFVRPLIEDVLQDIHDIDAFAEDTDRKDALEEAIKRDIAQISHENSMNSQVGSYDQINAVNLGDRLLEISQLRKKGGERDLALELQMLGHVLKASARTRENKGQE